MQTSSWIRSASLGLLGSAASALVSVAALAEAPVRSTQVSYARGGGDQNGYSRASVGLNYKFIRCDNEIHLAYSLDNKSVRVSDTYSYNGKEVTAAAPVPTPPTITLSGRVTEGGSTTALAQVSDGLAAPALGYGCFSGQTKRVGPVPAGSPADVDAYLSSLVFIPSDMPQLLRNGAVENTQAMAERAERQQLAAEREKTEQAAARQVEQARVQAAKAQSAQEAKALAAANQTKVQKAEVDAELAAESLDSPASIASRLESAPSQERQAKSLKDANGAKNEQGTLYAACSWNEFVTPSFEVNENDFNSLQELILQSGDDVDTKEIVGEYYKNELDHVERWMTAIYVKKIWQTRKDGLYSPRLTWGAHCRVSSYEAIANIVLEEHQEGTVRAKLRSIELPWTSPQGSTRSLRVVNAAR